jgi:DNA processing protein
MTTANWASDQGKNVYAVPGNIDSEYCFGSNKLIRDGAIPLVVLDDLIGSTGLEKKYHVTGTDSFGTEEKQLIKLLLEHGEMTVDRLCLLTGKTVPEVNGLVSVLEMKGVVCMFLGKIFIAK